MWLWIKKYSGFLEPIFFYGFVAFSLYPLFSVSTFPFVDAPAHLGNASLVKQLWTEPQVGFLHQFISFNHTLVPNWSGHFILACLLHVVSPEVAEKILLVIVFAGFPLSVRYLLHVIRKEKKFLSLLAVPIAYNCYSEIGFYNFSLSLIFLFLNLGFFYHKILSEKTKWFHYVIMTLLLGGSYFSHIVGFLITALFMAICYFVYLSKLEGGILRGLFSQQSIFLGLAILPITVLAIIYTLSNHSDAGQISYLENGVLINHLKNGQLFMVFGGAESAWCVILSAVYGSVFLFSLIGFAKDARRRNVTPDAVLFLLFLLLLTAAYFYLPDGYGMGGFFSLRMAVMMFAFIIPFAAVSNAWNWLLWPLICLALVTHTQRLSFYKEIQTSGNRVATAIKDQSKFVESNSFIVVCDLQYNWIEASYSHYLCLEKPVVTLNNYEYNTLFFPLLWKSSKMEVIHRALYNFKALELCKEVLGYHSIYYWVKGNPADQGSAGQALKKNLENNCTLVNSNIFASLYKLR
jgi:hypothetical protein